jgi:hypothetical protein
MYIWKHAVLAGQR